MFVGSVQIISRLNSPFKVQMFGYFPAAMLVERRTPPTWRLHTRNLRKTFRRISEDWENAETWKVPFLPILYNMTISWFYPLNGFRFTFSLRDNENDLEAF